MTTTQTPQATTPDFQFAGEWAIEADGELLVLFKDNDHTAAAVAAQASGFSLVREAMALGAEITVRALSVAEFQATCDHTFLDADGDCWRCGASTTYAGPAD